MKAIKGLSAKAALFYLGMQSVEVHLYVDVAERVGTPYMPLATFVAKWRSGSLRAIGVAVIPRVVQANEVGCTVFRITTM